MAEHPLDPIFHPRAIALVGVPRDQRSRSYQFFLRGLLDLGYPEHHAIYPVNPNATAIAGFTAYPTLLDTPDPVDHVISLVPAVHTPELVEQAITKGVRSIHFYTSGFEETGDADRAALEQQVIARARSAGIRVFGPNCMGLYLPGEGVSFSPNFPRESGDAFVLSQSGGNAMEIVAPLARRGFRYSKVISFGNGRDVGAADLLEYAAVDDESRIVLAYLEGVPDGPALFRALKACAAVKPTIILKGGMSAAGARAAQSHTASLAGAAELFAALCRQSGAALVDTMEELHDLAIAVSTAAREIRGHRAVLLGGGGGFSVLSTDAIARCGLDLPEFDAATQDALRAHVPVAGNSVRNPIDAGFMGDDLEAAMSEITRIAVTAPGADFTFAMISGPVRDDFATDQPTADDLRRSEERAIAQVRRLAALQQETGRPIIGVLRGYTPGTAPVALLEAALHHGLATFESIPRAARALQLLLAWRASREGLPPIV